MDQTLALELECPQDFEIALEHVDSILRDDDCEELPYPRKVVCRGQFFCWPKSRLVAKLFGGHYLGAFPLRSLQLQHLNFPFLVDGLSETVWATRHTLHSLELWDVRLCWHDCKDKGRMAASLTNHPTLEKATIKPISCCRSCRGEEDPSPRHNELLAALATCPLTDLHLSNVNLSWRQDGRVLASFHNHPSLQKMALNDLMWPSGSEWNWDGPGTRTLWFGWLKKLLASLSTCPKLYSLTLDTAMPRDVDFVAICDDMRLYWLSKATLKELVFKAPLVRRQIDNVLFMRTTSNRGGMTPVHQDYVSTIKSIANRLEINATLTRLSLSIPEECLLSFVEPLKRNHPLQCLELHLPENVLGSGDDAEMFAKVLRDCNDTLEHLVVPGFHFYRLLQYYLLLNRAGRKRLHNDEATDRECVDALVKYRESLDVVHFFLSKCPAILWRTHDT
ncbi:expressed unknown protein [Seminavis robusta]|uniref:Uncharacterized protein n=1 Tax=Seminavis robusta TaxID=568900 RepID=A0A9N8E6F9_9STRA|nr:expressed unknown protein [Seminavis robusta]|eukprot:Sro671_g184860.1 n/a (448) ;mRNA; f:21483-22826